MFTPHLNLWLIQNLSGKWGKQEDREEVGMTAGRKRGGGEEEILLQLEQTNAQKAERTREPDGWTDGTSSRQVGSCRARAAQRGGNLNFFGVKSVKMEES